MREPSLADPERAMRALSLHRFLLRFGLAGVNVFAWVFVFHYFYLVEPDGVHSLIRTALLYALSQTVTCLITPYAAHAIRAGVRRGIFLASLLATAAFTLLGMAFDSNMAGVFTPFAIALFAIALGLYRGLYWVPYEIESAAVRAAPTSFPREIVIALAPFFAGILIAAFAYGPVLLLYVGATVIALSIIPVFSLREVHEHFSWGYRETFARLLDRANRPLVAHAYFEGVVGAALLLFWPLAVFTITGWSYGVLGVIFSLSFVVAILMRSLVRGGIRRANLHRSRTLATALAVTPWLFRIVIGSPLGVVLVDAYFYTTTPRRLGVDPLAFEQSADSGSYVDEYTALKEMALALGRITVCFIGAGVALFTSLPVAFIVVFLVAGVASTMVVLRAR